MSDMTQAEKLLKSISHLLGEDSSVIKSNFDQVLQQLGQLIQSTNKDPSLLKKLSSDERIWQEIKSVLSSCVSKDQVIDIRVRLIRGVLILARNLITHIDGVQHFIDLNVICSIYQIMSNIYHIETEEKTKQLFYISVLQFLSNFTTVVDKDAQKEFDKLSVKELNRFVSYNEYWGDDLSLPFFKYLDNLTDLNEFLYIGLSHGDGKLIFERLLIEYEKIELENHEYSSFELLIIKIFNKLIIHESFLKFITVYNDDEVMIRYYKVAEAIITSKSNWEVFELTVILSWNYELFQKLVPEVLQYFKINEDGKEPIHLYEKISRNLDIFTSLVQYDHARKFLISYDGIENLVKLLGTLNQNIKAKRLKDTEKLNKEEGKIEYKSFPHTKSMIIEIVNALVYNNFEVQEKMREIHGLELVLSNCIINDNEPFIKERSIVCLRFLLLNNEKNQEFVSKLEAKQAVQDDTLDEAGFEVEIVDGKVKLKEKPKVQEVK